MVPEYFGLKEAGFSITPDPQYLYLSPRHQEALAHLLYGAGEGGGFVLLTGEVGTGKTTICRSFLEQLPEHVDLALILNPALSVPELLHAICDEFGVETPDGEMSAKLLVDRLNRYLLDAHAKGRRPVLMIDEAQNLSPEVLEQIRLLTNLETAKHKLLQIFLVGQPELHELLQRRDLRQLAQRITARYHLMPLDAAETAAYVRHRLAVAGTQHELFTPAALRRIHRFTGGVPRLINILCERALLGAYAARVHRVDHKIIARSWNELNTGPMRQRKRLPPLMTLPLLALTAGSGWLAHQQLSEDEAPTPRPAVAPVPPTAAVDSQLIRPIEDPEDAVAGTEQALEDRQTSQPLAPPDPALPRPTALGLLFAQWRVLPPPGDTNDPCTHAQTQGLRCKDGRGDWNDLRAYNRPALIPLNQADDEPGYGIVVGLTREQARLALPDKTLDLPLNTLRGRWNGDYLLLWRPAPGDRGLIGRNSPPATLRWLRETLDKSFDAPRQWSDTDSYSPELRSAIADFQRAQGLTADGIAGPETLIRLNTAANLPDTPHLTNDF